MPAISVVVSCILSEETVVKIPIQGGSSTFQKITASFCEAIAHFNRVTCKWTISTREIGCFRKPKISFTYTPLVGQILFRPKNSDLKHDPEIVFPLDRGVSFQLLIWYLNFMKWWSRVTLMAFDRLFTLLGRDFSFNFYYLIFLNGQSRIDTFSRQKYVVIGKMERE